MSRIFVRLPLVRGPLAGEQAPACLAALPRLWPGLPETGMPDGAAGGAPAPRGPWYTPANLPLSPRQALACLRDLQAMTDAALSGTPLRAWQGGQAASLRGQAESAARSVFAAGAGDETAALAAAEAAEERERLCRAQRLLLLCWLQEERLAEMAALHRRYAGDRAQLAATLDDGRERTEAPAGLPDDILRATTPDLPAEAAALAAMLLPWQRVLDAALDFLPQGAVIVAEAGLREALLERDDLAPAAAELRAAVAGEGGPALLSLTAPIWRVLLRPRCPDCCSRWERSITLLTWGDGA